MSISVRAATPRLAAILMLGVLTLGSGCARRQLGVLRVNGGPPDALVTVDDQYVGKLSRLRRFGIKVNEGEHRLTVEAPGHFPHDRVVAVPPAGTADVEVTLLPVPE